jgi:hypothetical protein
MVSFDECHSEMVEHSVSRSLSHNAQQLTPDQVLEPEFRLPIMITYLLFTATGFFAWGQAAYALDPWEVPVIVGLGSHQLRYTTRYHRRRLLRRRLPSRKGRRSLRCDELRQEPLCVRSH